MENKIWVVSKKALAFKIVVEMLEEEKQKYYITNEDESLWEKIEEDIKVEISNADIVYGVGLNGKKPENAVEISKCLGIHMDIKNYGNVIENVKKVINSNKMKQDVNFKQNDKDVENKVKIKQKKEDIIEERELKVIEEYINKDTIDALLGEFFIVETIVSNDKKIKTIQRTYYKNDQLFSKCGYENLEGTSNEIVWKQAEKIKDFPLDMDEKIILLINKEGFEKELDYNVIKGPMNVIPEVIGNIRLARNDLEFFNLKFERTDFEKIKMQKLVEKYNEKIKEIEEKLESLKNELVSLSDKADRKSIKQKIEKINDEVFQNQAICEGLKKEKQGIDVEIKKESEKSFQLGEIGNLVNNYRNEINKYKILYFEKKIKPNLG